MFINSINLKKLILENFDLVKQIGRVNKILKSKKDNINTIDILVLKEKLSLSFEAGIDLISQKERISQKLENLKKKSDQLKLKLKNKAYIRNAPKEIVQNDKKILKEITIEDEKLRSIVLSINKNV